MSRTVSVFCLLLSACGSPEPSPAPEQRLLDRAETAFLRRDYAQAAYLYDTALKEHPAFVPRSSVRLQLAKCRMGEERWDEAMRLLDEALASDPDETVRVEILYRRALVRNALWDPMAALRDLLAVEASSPSVRGRSVAEEEFRFRIGVTRIRAGDWRGGKGDLSKVPADGPFGAEARCRLGLDSFSVQIARAGDGETARRKVAEAARRGLAARIQDDRLVLVGNFDRFEDARRHAEQLRGQGFEGAFVLP